MSVLLTLLLGCPHPETPEVPAAPETPDVPETPDAPDAPMENFDPTLPPLAGTLLEAEVWGCESSDDCAVTFYQDGSCCDELCSSTSAYNTSFIEVLQQQREAECANVVCPVASCMATDVTHTAACIEGRCTYVAVE